MSVNDLLEEALQLPPELRADLAEKIVESLGSKIDPSIECSHLEEISKRREMALPQAQIIASEEALRQARSILGE